MLNKAASLESGQDMRAAAGLTGGEPVGRAPKTDKVVSRIPYGQQKWALRDTVFERVLPLLSPDGKPGLNISNSNLIVRPPDKGGEVTILEFLSTNRALLTIGVGMGADRQVDESYFFKEPTFRAAGNAGEVQLIEPVQYQRRELVIIPGKFDHQGAAVGKFVPVDVARVVNAATIGRDGITGMRINPHAINREAVDPFSRTKIDIVDFTTDYAAELPPRRQMLVNGDDPHQFVSTRGRDEALDWLGRNY
jgi:hypothetical protein